MKSTNISAKSSKKRIFRASYIGVAILLNIFNGAYAQVGINNTNPKVTLHVTPSSASDYTPEGIIAPHLTKEQLINKSSNYTSEHTGALIYVTETDIDSNTQTSLVTEEGYYYFNGEIWVGLMNRSKTAWKKQESHNNPVSEDDNIYQVGSVSIGSSETTPDNIQLQVKGNEYVTGKIKVGNNRDIKNSAQLELSDDDKGILINKVSLQGLNIPTPITDIETGLMVYNTNTIEAEGMAPGFHYWDGTRWLMLSAKAPQPLGMNLTNLQVNCTSTGGNANTSDKGTIIDLGEINIPDDGAYAFTFRLYGKLETSPATGAAGYYYLALLADGVIIDSVELDLIKASNTTALSATTSLMGLLKAGQKIEFRLTHHTSSPYPWTLNAIPSAGAKSANRTSMLWWKLS